MTAEDRAMYRLPEDALGAIHFRAIERIYGDSVSTSHRFSFAGPSVPWVVDALLACNAEHTVLDDLTRVCADVLCCAAVSCAFTGCSAD